MSHRVLVCGGRAYRVRLEATLAMLHRERPFTALIHGDAGCWVSERIAHAWVSTLEGADKLAGRWAEANGIPVEIYPADWRRYGKMAGPLRNEAMLLHGRPDRVVGFPGASGTFDCCTRAERYGVPVLTVGFSLRQGTG